MDEVKDFHPLVERWLRKQGYKTEHHVRLDYGIVDFIATHRETGEVLCVECKSHPETGGRFFAQVLDYVRQVPGSVPCVVMPSFIIGEDTLKICDYYAIRLIEIEMAEPVYKSKKKPSSCIPKIREQKLSFVRHHSDLGRLRYEGALQNIRDRLFFLESLAMGIISDENRPIYTDIYRQDDDNG